MLCDGSAGRLPNAGPVWSLYKCLSWRFLSLRNGIYVTVLSAIFRYEVAEQQTLRPVKTLRPVREVS